MVQVLKVHVTGKTRKDLKRELGRITRLVGCGAQHGVRESKESTHKFGLAAKKRAYRRA